MQHNINNEDDERYVWFITGCSGIGGFGNLLVRKLLSIGQIVIATSRCKNRLIQDIDKELINDNNFLAIEMNLSDEENVKNGILEAIDKFKRIDILISNAATGTFGPLEEITDKETKSLFDINFFGPLNLIRNSLPYLRNQFNQSKTQSLLNNKSKLNGSRIVIIGSICGHTSLFNGTSIYCASKHALHSISETLSIELKPFNIHTINVAPGYYNTNFFKNVYVPSNRIQDYSETHNFIDSILNSNGSDFKNDTSKAVDIIIEISKLEIPPNNILLGPDSYELFDEKFKKLTNELLINKEICTKTI